MTEYTNPATDSTLAPLLERITAQTGTAGADSPTLRLARHLGLKADYGPYVACRFHPARQAVAWAPWPACGQCAPDDATTEPPAPPPAALF